MKHAVEIYTDGACRGNPGPGGWGALLRYGDVDKQLYGGEHLTTNNRMELKAVIEALSALSKPCKVTLTSDSTYVLKGISEWLPNWKKRGWRTAGKKPVKNGDLWKTLDDLAENLKLIVDDLQKEDTVLEDYPKNLPVGRPNELIPAKYLTVNWGDFELLEITE